MAGTLFASSAAAGPRTAGWPVRRADLVRHRGRRRGATHLGLAAYVGEQHGDEALTGGRRLCSVGRRLRDVQRNVQLPRQLLSLALLPPVLALLRTADDLLQDQGCGFAGA